MKYLLWLLTAVSGFASVDDEATKRIIAPFADADRLVIWRASLCHPNWVNSRTMATVVGTEEVRKVMSHFEIERYKAEKVIDPDTGEEVEVGRMTLIACSDYVFYFYRRDREMGRIALIMNYIIQADGESGDLHLTSASRLYFERQFGIVADPDQPSEKKG